MNFRHFGNQFKSSSRHFSGFNKAGGANNFARNFATMNNMTLRMAQRSMYQYQLGAFMAHKGIMGSPAMMSLMLQQQQTANIATLTHCSDDLLSLLKNELLLDSEDDTL